MPLLAVNHHYFRPIATGRGIYPVTPSALTAEVHALRANGWRIGNESDIIAELSGELSTDDQVCVLTFDDGLKEQLGALTHLDALGACAMFFVPTAPLVDRIVLDVHKLHMVHATLDEVEIAADLDRRFGLMSHAFDEMLLRNQYPYDTPISGRLKYFLNFVLDHEQRREWIDRTFEAAFGDERVAADALYMNPDDIRILARRRLLGSHGHAHVPLARQKAEQIRRDLEQSSEILATLSGTKPLGVSYPFGNKAALSQEVYEQAREVGYSYGLTMTRGINSGGAEVDRLALRRININDLDAYVVTEPVRSTGPS